MSGIVGSYFNTRGSGVVAKLGTDGQVFTSTGAGLSQGFETIAAGVTAAEATAIRQDINTLALHSAIADNKAAYNLTDSFIDQFESDTGIQAHVTTDRVDEYVASVYTTAAVHQAITGLTWVSPFYDYAGVNALTYAQDDDSYTFFCNTSSASTSGYVTADLGASYTISKIDVGKRRGAADLRSIKLTSSTDNSTYTDIDLTSTTTILGDYTGSSPDLSNFGADGTADWAAFDGSGHDVIRRMTDFTPFVARYLRFKAESADFHDNNFQVTQFKFNHTPTFLTDGATGTVEGIANVPTTANQTEVSGVMLYKNNEGTATIGGGAYDLKIEFTCDGGSNWTEADSYTAVTPLFSTGIKMVKLGKTTCTAGNDVRYRATWANQSSGSKETQLHGIAVNY